MYEVGELALNANLAFTLACESVNNIDVADVVYPVQKEGFIDILKPFNESVAHNFSDYENVSSGLHTPTAEAINECVEYLLPVSYTHLKKKKEQEEEKWCVNEREIYHNKM
ncbi:hypothetical protein OO18_29310 [Raoultella ornithinolytica]|nr:hypothetical protein OO18_29310 [Raoultella ornithinolytica]